MRSEPSPGSHPPELRVSGARRDGRPPGGGGDDTASLTLKDTRQGRQTQASGTQADPVQVLQSGALRLLPAPWG